MLDSAIPLLTLSHTLPLCHSLVFSPRPLLFLLPSPPSLPIFLFFLFSLFFLLSQSLPSIAHTVFPASPVHGTCNLTPSKNELPLQHTNTMGLAWSIRHSTSIVPHLENTKHAPIGIKRRVACPQLAAICCQLHQCRTVHHLLSRLETEGVEGLHNPLVVLYSRACVEQHQEAHVSEEYATPVVLCSAIAATMHLRVQLYSTFARGLTLLFALATTPVLYLRAHIFVVSLIAICALEKTYRWGFRVNGRLALRSGRVDVRDCTLEIFKVGCQGQNGHLPGVLIPKWKSKVRNAD